MVGYLTVAAPTRPSSNPARTGKQPRAKRAELTHAQRYAWFNFRPHRKNPDTEAATFIECCAGIYEKHTVYLCSCKNKCWHAHCLRPVVARHPPSGHQEQHAFMEARLEFRTRKPRSRGRRAYWDTGTDEGSFWCPGSPSLRTTDFEAGKAPGAYCCSRPKTHSLSPKSLG